MASALRFVENSKNDPEKFTKNRKLGFKFPFAVKAGSMVFYPFPSLFPPSTSLHAPSPFTHTFLSHPVPLYHPLVAGF
jgi:hypothetical protein